MEYWRVNRNGTHRQEIGRGISIPASRNIVEVQYDAHADTGTSAIKPL
jgi:hypothetical protein